MKSSMLSTIPQNKRETNRQHKSIIAHKPQTSSVDSRPQFNYKEVMQIIKEEDMRKDRIRQQQDDKVQRGLKESKMKEQEHYEQLKQQRAQKAGLQLVELKIRQEKRVINEKEGNDKLKQVQKLNQQQQIKQLDEDLLDVSNIVLQQQLQQTLNYRKQKLQQIRDLHKPVTKEEMFVHQQKIQDYQRKFEEAKKQEIEKLQKSLSVHHNYSLINHDFLKREQVAYQEEEARLLKHRELQERKKKFAQEIRENFKPAPDKQKLVEFQALQEKIHHKANFKSYQIVAQNVRRKKYNNHIFTQVEEQKVNNSTERLSIEQNRQVISQQADQRQLGNQYLQFLKVQNKASRGKYHRKLNQSQDQIQQLNSVQESSQPIIQLQRKKNYMKEKDVQDQFPDRDILNDWQKYARDKKMDDIKKNDSILSEAYKLEEVANRQEILSRIKYSKNFHDDSVDRYLIEAIKAKLQVLDN